MIWLWFTLLAVAATLVVAWPAFSRPQVRVDRDQANVAAYRTRRQELDAEREAGLITDELHASALAELDRRLLAEADGDEASPAPPRDRRRRALVIVVAAILPLAAMLTYWQAGSWRTQARIALAEHDPAAAMLDVAEEMTVALRRTPEAEGYALLGAIWLALDRPEAAVEAYANANRLSERPTPDWMVAEGEALGARQNRDLRGAPMARFQAALELEPLHPRALWYAGIAALQAGDRDETMRYWRMLASHEDLDQEQRNAVRERIADLGGAVDARQEAEQIELPVASGDALSLMVMMDDAIELPADGRAVLFVFARAADGPPMPIAAARIASPSLPLEVRLDDRHSLDPSRPLSGYGRLQVGARLSLRGDASARSGDIEADVITLEGMPAEGELRLDRVRP